MRKLSVLFLFIIGLIILSQAFSYATRKWSEDIDRLDYAARLHDYAKVFHVEAERTGAKRTNVFSNEHHRLLYGLLENLPAPKKREFVRYTLENHYWLPTPYIFKLVTVLYDLDESAKWLKIAILRFQYDSFRCYGSEQEFGGAMMIYQRNTQKISRLLYEQPQLNLKAVKSAKYYLRSEEEHLKKTKPTWLCEYSLRAKRDVFGEKTIQDIIGTRSEPILLSKIILPEEKWTEKYEKLLMLIDKAEGEMKRDLVH